MGAMAPGDDGIVILGSGKEWAMGEMGPCLIVVVRGALTEQVVLQINEGIWNITQRLPGQCGYINVIESTSPPPNAGLRKLIMAGLERPGLALACLAAVIEGSEFRLTLVRAILAGMALLRPSKQPSKVFKHTHETSLWVKKQLGGDDAFAADIVRALDVIRSRIG